MITKITDVKELKYKTGKALRFNLHMEFQLYTDVWSHVAIPGFRWMDGAIHPPMGRQQSRWYPLVYIGGEIGKDVYDTLEKKIVELGLEGYALVDKELAIEPLKNTVQFLRTFKGLV